MSDPSRPPPHPDPELGPWGQAPGPDDWRTTAEVATPGGRRTAPAPDTWAPVPTTAPPASPAPRRSRAKLALTLSVAGLLCCGLPSVVGMLLARGEIDAMNRGELDSSHRTSAEAAFAVGILGTVVMVLIFVGWGFVINASR